MRDLFEKADLAKWAMELGLRRTVRGEVSDAELERWAAMPQDDPAHKNMRKLARKELARRAAGSERERRKAAGCPQGTRWIEGECRAVAHAHEGVSAQDQPLVERQKARRVKAMAGTGHRSGADPDLIRAEFAAQKGVSGHSSEVLGYLANLPTVGRNPKLRKQARKFLAMRGHEACKPGEHMTFGVCRKVGATQEDAMGGAPLLEYEVFVNRDGWANDDEGNRWYVGTDLWPPGTYFGRDADRIVRISRESRGASAAQQRRNDRLYHSRRTEDTMRGLLRRLEEGQGVKPVVTWDGIIRDFLSPKGRKDCVDIAMAMGKDNGWRLDKGKPIYADENADVDEFILNIPVESDYTNETIYYDDRNAVTDTEEEEQIAAGIIWMAILREEDDRKKKSNLLFSVSWEVPDLPHKVSIKETNGDAREIISFEKFATQYGADWRRVFQRIIEGMGDAGQIPKVQGSTTEQWTDEHSRGGVSRYMPRSALASLRAQLLKKR